MGNVNMEASQINDRTGSSKMSVAQHLKALDAIAAAIEGLPTFTSNDKAFLEELPAFPSEDGKKALVATTTSGETSLEYEEVLPEDPETDGVRVLTATTSEGETAKSWEELQAGENVIFDNTEREIGTWEGSKLYRRTFSFTATGSSQYNVELDGNAIYSKAFLLFGYIEMAQGDENFFVPVCTPMTNGTWCYGIPMVKNNKLNLAIAANYGAISGKSGKVVILYTKTTA